MRGRLPGAFWRRALAGIAAFGTLAAALSHATEPLARVSARLVLVPVTVTDRNGKPVMGLKPEDVRIFEGSERRDVVSFRQEDAPASVAIVLDLSGSMRDNIPQALAAVKEITGVLQEEDDVALISFADRPQVLAAFPSDPESLPGRLMQAKASGDTALIDAVYLAVHQVRAASNPRKAVVVVSDGADTCSRYTEKELNALVVESGVQIYTVGIADSVVNRSEVRGLYLLRELSELSGGLHFTVRDRSVLPEAARRLAASLKNLYVLGYRPQGQPEPGKWRKIRVAIDRYKALRISARTGYFEP